MRCDPTVVRPRRPRRFFRRLAPTLSLLAACTAWSARPTPITDPAAQRSGYVRVLLRDGTRIVISDMTVQSDSVVGFIPHHTAPSTRFAVPVSEVVSVQPREISTSHTLALLFVITAVAGAVLLMLYSYGQGIAD